MSTPIDVSLQQNNLGKIAYRKVLIETYPGND
jgi:hypothetical protein